MFFELITAIVIGTLTGIITGITPGIHVNLVSFILITYNEYIPGTIIHKIIFVISMCITHSFLDAIPSIYLGVPDSDEVLMVMPAHKLLLEGRAYEALKLTVVGALYSLIMILLMAPFLIITIPIFYPYLNEHMGALLILIVIISLLKTKDNKMKFWSFAVFLISGCLGIIVLNMPELKDPLLPMLSGIFGASGLLLSLKSDTKLPKQVIDNKIEISNKVALKSSFISSISGGLTGLFPGLSGAQASMIGMQFLSHSGIRTTIVMLGGISTANFLFSVITLYSINKARNGAIIAIMELKNIITFSDLFVIISATLFSTVLSVLLCLYIGRKMSYFITKVDYFKLNLAVLFFLICVVFYFTGLLGFIVFLISTIVGLIAPLKGVAKTNAMGCLLLPTIIYFLCAL